VRIVPLLFASIPDPGEERQPNPPASLPSFETALPDVGARAIAAGIVLRPYAYGR